MARLNIAGESPALFAKGLAMGVADIIPGVSGGTIAFITGIYERLISAINSVRPAYALTLLKLPLTFNQPEKFSSHLKELARIDWGFILPLGGGILTAVLLMARVIPHLLENFPLQMYSLFFGLILFSVPLVAREIKWQLASFLVCLIFAIGVFLLLGIERASGDNTSLIYLFLSGAVAICAMVMPGISGSYILLLLGQYENVLNAVRSWDILSLAVFVSGIVVGLLSFARLLKYLLEHFRTLTLAALTGTMLGGLRAIWPGAYIAGAENTSTQLTSALIMAILGGLLIFFLSRLSRSNPHKAVS